MARHRIFGMSFASIHPLYVTKVERKGRTRAEVDEVITWLTGYDAAGLEQVIASEVDLETFFGQAPRMNPDASLITGLICGYRVEEIEDPLALELIGSVGEELRVVLGTEGVQFERGKAAPPQILA